MYHKKRYRGLSVLLCMILCTSTLSVSAAAALNHRDLETTLTITNDREPDPVLSLQEAGNVLAPTGSIAIQNNNFEGNQTYGVNSNIAITAENNWWNDIDGPTHASNPSGSGDAVSDNVDFNPWLTSAIDIGVVHPPSPQPGIVMLSQNNFENNYTYGVQSSTPITVENNWWGDATGPYHPTLNPDGQGNSVSDNVDFDPWLTSAVDIGVLHPPSPQPGIVTLLQNTFEDNATYGIQSSLPITAEYNWWGDATGPYHPTLNPGGLGDNVSDNVDFDPWLTAPPNPPALEISPVSLDFGDTTTQLTFVIQNANSGSSPLNWTIEEYATWLGCESVSGNTEGDGEYSGSEDETVTVTVGRIGMRETVYNTEIIVTSNGGNVTLPVHMVVGPPRGQLSLIVPSMLDIAQSIAGYALVQNPQTAGYEFYRIEFSLMDGDTPLDTYTGYANSVPAQHTQQVAFDFGPQPIGNYEVEAELYIADGWLAGQIQDVTVSSEADRRAIDEGERITRAANSTLDHIKNEGGIALAEGVVEAGQSTISLMFSFIGKIGSGLSETGQIAVEAVTAAERKLTVFIYNLAAVLSSEHRENSAKAQVDVLLSPQRRIISDRQQVYNTEILQETFTWDPDFEGITIRWVSEIERIPQSRWFLVPTIYAPHITTTTFDGFVFQFKVLLVTLKALSDVLLILLAVVAIVLIIIVIVIAIAGSGGAATPLLILLGSLWHIYETLHITEVVGGFVALSLVLSLVFMGAVQVAPEVTEAHSAGLEELTTAIQSATGRRFTDFTTQVQVSGKQISLATGLTNSDNASAHPLVHTYIFNTSGDLVKINQHQPDLASQEHDTLNSQLYLQPGTYRAVSVIHTRDQIGLAATLPVLFTVENVSVDLTVSLDDSLIAEGEAAHATIIVANTAITPTGDLLVYAEYGDGENGEVWTLNLDGGESDTISYDFVPSATGLLRTCVINEWGVLEQYDTPYVVGSGASLALNMSPGKTYDWGEDVEVAIHFSNPGNQQITESLHWVTSRMGDPAGAVYSETIGLVGVPGGYDVITTTWIASPVPGPYQTILFLDDLPYASFAYSVRADETLFANVWTDALTYNTGETVSVDLDVTNSAFAAADPDNATVTVTAPDGATQAISLSHTTTGHYVGQYTPIMSGTYTLDAVLSSVNSHVVSDSAYFVVTQASALFPTVNGDLFLLQVSPITVTVQNENGLTLGEVSVVLSSTETLLHEITDGSGHVSFSVYPQSGEPYQLLLEKPGFAAATSQIPIRMITDTVAPPLTVILPEITNSSLLTVTGKTEVGVDLLIRGQSTTVDDEGFFTATVTLITGDNLIQASATDEFGNTTTVTKTVVLDTIPPALTLATPQDGAYVGGDTVQVAGSTEAGAQVVVNGVVAPTEINGSFAIWTLLSEGDNIIAVSATDKAENSTTVTRTVQKAVDIVGVTITGPITGTVQTTYTFTATANPTATLPITYVWYTAGQAPLTHSSRGLSDTVTFSWGASGIKTITVTAANIGTPITDTHVITITERLDVPIATFSANVVNGTAPLTVTFTAVTSGTVEGWLWKFGDSATALIGPVVQHTYQMPGVFDVSLTVSNTYGSSTFNKSAYITVSSGEHRVYLPLVLRN